MLRVLDVARALTSRGWAPHVHLDLDLDVLDDVFPENAGRWTVRIAEGRAEVARGGSGSTRIDVRALAALYSSWLDPVTLVATGGLAANDADAAKLAAAFAGPSPWMPDAF